MTEAETNSQASKIQASNNNVAEAGTGPETEITIRWGSERFFPADPLTEESSKEDIAKRVNDLVVKSDEEVKDKFLKNEYKVKS